MTHLILRFTSFLSSYSCPSPFLPFFHSYQIVLHHQVLFTQKLFHPSVNCTDDQHSSFLRRPLRLVRHVFHSLSSFSSKGFRLRLRPIPHSLTSNFVMTSLTILYYLSRSADEQDFKSTSSQEYCSLHEKQVWKSPCPAECTPGLLSSAPSSSSSSSYSFSDSYSHLPFHLSEPTRQTVPFPPRLITLFACRCQRYSLSCLWFSFSHWHLLMNSTTKHFEPGRLPKSTKTGYRWLSRDCEWMKPHGSAELVSQERKSLSPRSSALSESCPVFQSFSLCACEPTCNNPNPVRPFRQILLILILFF